MSWVLVVDDSPFIRRSVEYALGKGGGLDVETVSCGREGLQAVAAEPPPSVVLLDLMLPDMEGEEVCRRLRDDGFQGKIYFLTAKGFGVDAEGAGADGVIPKPFSPGRLVELVKEAME